MGREAGEPAVSVIVTTYNVGRFVADAIGSALNQTFSDFELILGDDGSSDDTLEVAGSFADPRISVLAYPHHGPTAVLNDAFALARGRYIALLDGDDVWAPERLQRHVEYMDCHPETDLTFSLSRVVDENGKDSGMISRSFKGPLPFERLLADNLVANGSAVMIRRVAARRVGLFDTAMAASYDHDFWLRLALLRPGNITCIPLVLTSYRRRPGQITRDWRLTENAALYLGDKFHKLRPVEAARMDGRRRGNLYRYLAMIAFENRTCTDGMKLLFKSMAAAPIRFFITSRSYLTFFALAAGIVLPSTLLRWLLYGVTPRRTFQVNLNETGASAIRQSDCQPIGNATAIVPDAPDRDPDNPETIATA